VSLPAQLRAIADRLEAADSARRDAIGNALTLLAVELAPAMPDGSSIEPDSAAALAAADGEAAVPISPSSLIQQAGSLVAQAPAAALTTADSAPPGLHTCPECGKQTPTPAGLVTHRSRVHHVKPRPTPAQGLSDRKKPASNGDSRPFSFPIGKGAIPPAPVIRHGKETYLCPRCPASFPTAEALKGHLMKGHPPVGSLTRPFGEQPVMERSGGGFRD